MGSMTVMTMMTIPPPRRKYRHYRHWDQRAAVMGMAEMVPVWEKANLTLEEAAAYFGIGINKLREITNNERKPPAIQRLTAIPIRQNPPPWRRFAFFSSWGSCFKPAFSRNDAWSKAMWTGN